ncbi:MAG TPA: L-seryl-tRNA(Sec) selenium transferase [Myxococcales bacterium]|nr:L-seryl-tRNA(Sec) selenium transferase [Myxococcales bacterium]
MKERLRDLPSVDEVLARPAVRALSARVGRAATKAAVRAAIAEAREKLRSGAGIAGEPVPDARVEELGLLQAAPRLRPVINASGVVLHTNLGRAPLHPEAVAQVASVAGGYSNLELDLATGRRGHRSAHLEPLLCELFAAEAAHVVNNCAGATMLALAALGKGGVAVVSRGELVEIGGGFRVPEILAQSGCRLVEVGTTNRTRISDYAAALEANPGALILRVHRSNFALVGFTQTPGVADLAALAREKKALLLHDLGSGALDPALGETTASQSLGEGADLVMISGDKLLGGPQAGIMLGRRDPVERCRKHPLSRALRADRMLLAALEATLRLYRDGRAAELPALRAIQAPPAELRQRATRLALQLQEKGIACSVVECEGRVGGGSLPQARLPGAGVALEGDARALLDALREGDPPVLALLRDGRVVLDVRCVTDTAELALAVGKASARATAGKADRLGGAAEGGAEPRLLRDPGESVAGDPLDTEV